MALTEVTVCGAGADWRDTFGVLTSASVDLRLTFNEPCTADITFSAHDPAAGALFQRASDGSPVGVLRREMRVSVDGKVRFQGPCVRMEIRPDGEVRARCVGFSWWLLRRFIGSADRENLIDNGDFDTGSLSPWADVGNVDLVPSPDGWAVQLANGGSIANAFTRAAHDQPQGAAIRFGARLKLASGATTPVDDVWFEVICPDGGQPAYQEVKFDLATIPRDTWVELPPFGTVVIPGDLTPHDVVIVAHGPAVGSLQYEVIRANEPESVGSNGVPPGQLHPADPAEVGVVIVDYLQSPGQHKDDVGITGVAHSSGEEIVAIFEEVNHEAVERVFGQLTERGSVDWWEDHSDRSIHFGPLGTLRDEWRLQSGVNFAGPSVTIDGVEVCTSAVVIGVGTDFTRDEGGFALSTDLPVLERVEHAPVSMQLTEYDRWAEQLVAERSRVPELVAGTATWPLSALDDLVPGDSVPVHHEVGHYRVDGVARILALRVDPARGTVTPELSVTAT